MINKLYQLKETDIGNKVSNVGGWQNSEILTKFKEFSPIVDLVKNKLNLDGVFNDGMWGNISSTTHYNNLHIHGEIPSLWSGVYYLQTPLNSGDIIFYNNLSEIVKEYSPKVGDLLIFHSSLPHSVGVNNSNQDRISIAFNFEVK
tara:strand:+ start:1681 stop:2115 length:435 start_codon:yes stop_codon:yes gene_type:complete